MKIIFLILLLSLGIFSFSNADAVRPIHECAHYLTAEHVTDFDCFFDVSKYGLTYTMRLHVEALDLFCPNGKECGWIQGIEKEIRISLISDPDLPEGFITPLLNFRGQSDVDPIKSNVFITQKYTPNLNEINYTNCTEVGNIPEIYCQFFPHRDNGYAEITVKPIVETDTVAEIPFFIDILDPDNRILDTRYSLKMPIHPPDITFPKLLLPPNIVADTDDLDGKKIVFFVDATDNLDDDVEIYCTHESGSIFPLGRTTVKCTATDDYGNTSAQSFLIDVLGPPPPLSENILVDNTSLSVNYMGASIGSIVPNFNAHSLLVKLDSNNPSVLTIDLPSDLIVSKDSNQNNVDFFVLVNNEEGHGFSEIHTTDSNRRLSISVPWGTETIEIIGTSVLSSGLTHPDIPSWVKNNAGWWAGGLIGDDDFVKGIQYLINHDIIIIPDSESGENTDSKIPSWVKNNAGWWAGGLIGDDDFVVGIQYLISNGILIV